VTGARPPISVAIATGEGWPYVRDLLAAITADVEAVGGEIVVADGSEDKPPPEPGDISRVVRWIEAPGESVFVLFAIAMKGAQGDVVALTEDHAIPRPGWVEAILRAHREHPAAAAIGGAIENGSTHGLVEWASYFTTQGPHMAPLGNRAVPMTTNEANVSYKRTVVEEMDPDEGSGFMAILYNRRLAEAGKELRVDDRIVVDHFETVGFGWTTSIHFHNGRTISGFRRERGMSREEWLRMATSLMLPAWRTMRVLRTGLAKGRLRRQLLVSAPFAVWLEYVQALGHLTGYVAGPGGSPDHLR
jgi:GT2 family glycosyltransferase